MTALRCLPQFGVDCRCPRQRIDGLRRASSPFLDLPCDSARSTSSMRSDQLLLPTTSTTSTRASRVPSIFPRLAPRSPPKTCDLAKETGGPCVSRRNDPLRRVVRVRVWRFRPIAPKPTGPLASLSLSRSSPAAFAWGRETSRKPRPRRQVLREEQPTSLARDAFHRQLSRFFRGER